MQANSSLAIVEQANVYNRESLFAMYGTQKYDCDRIIIIEKPSGITHEFEKPLFGSMILEHNPVRTVVQRLGAFGRVISCFTTYDPVSWQIENV